MGCYMPSFFTLFKHVIMYMYYKPLLYFSCTRSANAYYLFRQDTICSFLKHHHFFNLKKSKFIHVHDTTGALINVTKCLIVYHQNCFDLTISEREWDREKIKITPPAVRYVTAKTIVRKLDVLQQNKYTGWKCPKGILTGHCRLMLHHPVQKPCRHYGPILRFLLQS